MIWSLKIKPTPEENRYRTLFNVYGKDFYNIFYGDFCNVYCGDF